MKIAMLSFQVGNRKQGILKIEFIIKCVEKLLIARKAYSICFLPSKCQSYKTVFSPLLASQPSKIVCPSQVSSAVLSKVYFTKWMKITMLSFQVGDRKQGILKIEFIIKCVEKLLTPSKAARKAYSICFFCQSVSVPKLFFLLCLLDS